MVTTKLTHHPGTAPKTRRSMRTLDSAADAGRAAAAVACTAALVLVTAAAAGAGAVDPALAPATAPHPVLHPTLAAAASILATNARVLALPYGLLLLRLDDVDWGRLIGSAALAGMLALNAITVGLAIGHWQSRLTPYLPQLPLEWAAAGVAASAWAHTLIRHRRDPGPPAPALRRRALALNATVTLTLLSAAAAVEVLLTPHAA